VESASLVTKNMIKSLFPDSSIVTEHFLRLPKSHTAIFDDQVARNIG